MKKYFKIEQKNFRPQFLRELESVDLCEYDVTFEIKYNIKDTGFMVTDGIKATHSNHLFPQVDEKSQTISFYSIIDGIATFITVDITDLVSVIATVEPARYIAERSTLCAACDGNQACPCECEFIYVDNPLYKGGTI
jgi:hypothetical protein